MTPDRLGTAQWADPEEVGSRFAFADGAFWLGRTLPQQKAIGVKDDRHVLLVAGTRSGKGTSIIIPNLCLWPGSVVVVDPTGDNATITAARRGDGAEHCDKMGQKVYVLDPYRASKVDDKYRATFNPLDMLDPSSRTAVRDAERIASALVPPNPEVKEQWALNGARRLIASVILYVKTATWPWIEGRRNLVTVRDLILRGDVAWRDRNAELGADASKGPFDLLWGGMTLSNAFNGEIAGAGEHFASMSKNSPTQWTGVHDEAVIALKFLNNDDMRECLSSSSFSLRDIRTEPKGVSLYLTVPSKDKVEDFRWLRTLISMSLAEMESEQRTPATGHPTLFVLDEFAGLQKMDAIESGISEMAKYGVKLFLVLQSLPQLKQVYGDNWETYLANCGTKIFFGIDDHFTREYISKYLGDTQIEIVEQGMGVGLNKSTGTQENTGESSFKQTGEGRSKGDSYKRAALGLRDTAGLFRKLSGSATANDSYEKSSAEGTGTESSKGTSEQTGGSLDRQWNARVHKRPLVTPDEVGKVFRRFSDSEEHLRYPGMAIVITSNCDHPLWIQRCNYFDDPVFESSYCSNQSTRSVQIPRVDHRFDETSGEEDLDKLCQHDGCKHLATERPVQAGRELLWRCILATQCYKEWGGWSLPSLPPKVYRGLVLMCPDGQPCRIGKCISEHYLYIFKGDLLLIVDAHEGYEASHPCKIHMCLRQYYDFSIWRKPYHEQLLLAVTGQIAKHQRARKQIESTQLADLEGMADRFRDYCNAIVRGERPMPRWTR